VIARLSGVLIERSITGSVIDVSGVGYALLHSLYTFESLPPEGHKVQLWTHLHVREDALQLFGFSTVVERRVFELLIGVSGVGPKLALAVLSGLAPASFARAIADENLGALTRIAGVGRKTAERIVIDLRDKLGPAGIAPAAALPDAPVPGRRKGAEPAAPAGMPGRMYEDALSALMALGLTRPAAIESVQKALDQGPVEVVEELVRRALAASAPKPSGAKPAGRPRVGV
jgi:Holliday junction DNA helicase RuvA